MKNLLIICYVIIFTILFFYSYTQIDLNLTLSSNIFYQNVQKQLINLGYFNRNLSAFIFLAIISALFILYLVLLYAVIRKKIDNQFVFILLGITLFISLLSYPAFSHDIFNYMFDARIVTKYFANPYIHKALDFPSDQWIRFMHWTHRTYPYGPLWIIMTLPLSLLGYGKFVLTLFNFKLFFVLFHALNLYFLSKILIKVKRNVLLGVTFYAFNPLIIIESLVSPHNEVIMLTFLLVAIYMSFHTKSLVSPLIYLLMSGAVKFTTFICLPLLFFKSLKLNKRYQLYIIFFLLTFSVIIEIIYREAYSWYFILPWAVSTLLGNRYISQITICLSMGLLLRYYPFLLYGDYSSQVSTLQQNYFYSSLIIGVVSAGVMYLYSKRQKFSYE